MKKPNKVAFVLEAIYKNCDMFKYPGSRYKVARLLRTKKPKSEVAFMLKAIHKKCDVFKYPKVFQLR